MLILTRKPSQSIRIGDDVVITVTRIQGKSVKIGIEAPNSLRITRSELQPFDSTEVHSSEEKSPAGKASDETAEDVPVERGLSIMEDLRHATNPYTMLMDLTDDEAWEDARKLTSVG